MVLSRLQHFIRDTNADIMITSTFGVLAAVVKMLLLRLCIVFVKNLFYNTDNCQFLDIFQNLLLVNGSSKLLVLKVGLWREYDFLIYNINIYRSHNNSNVRSPTHRLSNSLYCGADNVSA